MRESKAEAALAAIQKKYGVIDINAETAEATFLDPPTVPKLEWKWEQYSRSYGLWQDEVMRIAWVNLSRDGYEYGGLGIGVHPDFTGRAKTLKAAKQAVQKIIRQNFGKRH